MKTIAVILLLSCCALAQDKPTISAAEAGCSPQDQKFEVNADQSQTSCTHAGGWQGSDLFRRGRTLGARRGLH